MGSGSTPTPAICFATYGLHKINIFAKSNYGRGFHVHVQDHRSDWVPLSEHATPHFLLIWLFESETFQNRFYRVTFGDHERFHSLVRPGDHERFHPLVRPGDHGY